MGLEPRCRLRPDDLRWVPRRAPPRWTWHCPAVVLLGRCHVLLLVRCEGIGVRARGGWPEGDGRWRQGAPLEGPVVDRGQLVDLPDRVHHSIGGLPRPARARGTGCALHPVRLLPLGYHLEVRCRAPDLPDHLRQVAAREGWPARLSDGLESLQGI